jgi:pimeloyl-ACP methyl ester carboxylesterase
MKKTMQILLPILILIIVIPVITLIIMSPGKPAPFLGKDGKPLSNSLSEKVIVTINGSRQGMFIKSKDLSNPVLLYIHGGIPDYFLTQQYPTGMDEYFTVVWWDMRGMGTSFDPNIQKESMTTDLLVSDVLEVTKYLRERFHQEKIYLMAHSGGSFYGIQAVKHAPENYQAYIAVAQITNQLKSEMLAYDYMLTEFKKNGKAKMVAEMEKAPVTPDSIPLPASYANMRDPGMHLLGIGTIRAMDSIVTGLLIPSFQFREYTLGEKINLWRGKVAYGSTTFNAQLKTDITKEVPEVKIPVYFFHGIYDYTVNYNLAKAYFAELKAPLKAFYTFEKSAHSPLFEEPEKMGQIIQKDVLKGKADLADK